LIEDLEVNYEAEDEIDDGTDIDEEI